VACATVPLNRAYWETVHPVSSENTRVWQEIVRNLLPSPATAKLRLRLAQSVTNDIAVVVLGGMGMRALITFLTSGSMKPAVLLGHPGLMILYGAVVTLIGYSERLYHPETLGKAAMERLILAKVLLWSTFLLCMGLSSCPQSAALLIGIAGSAPVNFLLLMASRHCAQRSKRNGTSRRVRNVLIVGAGRLGRKVARSMERNHAVPRMIRGFLDDSYPAVGDVLGGVDELALVARRVFIDEVVITLPLESEAAQKVIRQARLNRLDVRIVPFVPQTADGKITLEMFDEIPILTLHEEAVPSVSLLLKRCADVVVSTIGLLALSPFLVLIAVTIKAESPGPVLYRAARVGFKGMRFVCYKFRTMVADADQFKEQLRKQNEREGAFFKIKDDPRITRVGKILRRYSLDELPQLWNVLKGEMSLVGPRPHPLDDAARYRVEDLQRLEVMPGLTGLWQVTARRDPSFERSMALDREYIGRWSLGMDFQILCKTVGTVLRGSGS